MNYLEGCIRIINLTFLIMTAFLFGNKQSCKCRDSCHTNDKYYETWAKYLEFCDISKSKRGVLLFFYRSNLLDAFVEGNESHLSEETCFELIYKYKRRENIRNQIEWLLVKQNIQVVENIYLFGRITFVSSNMLLSTSFSVGSMWAREILSQYFYSNAMWCRLKGKEKLLW